MLIKLFHLVMNDVIAKIKELRLAKGLSHENMAHELHISQAAYCKLENNETKLSVERLFQISEILKASVGELLSINPNTIYNQTNNDSSTGYIQQVENLYQDNKELNKQYTDSLIAEIDYLKLQNKELLALLKKK